MSGPARWRSSGCVRDDAHFAVHAPVPAPFGDEGAANHMRLCRSHGEPGLEIFVYGK
jgi:succinylarginine dihydrolase